VAAGSVATPGVTNSCGRMSVVLRP
jgi:hypothetical protein